MDTKVIDLMVDVLEEHLDEEVIAFQPAEEKSRFIVSVGNAVMLVDGMREIFVPLNRGKSMTYLDAKKILKKVGLKYKTRTEYGL